MVTINNNYGGGGGNFPHLLHFVITVLTCGLWLPVWVLHYCIKG